MPVPPIVGVVHARAMLGLRGSQAGGFCAFAAKLRCSSAAIATAARSIVATAVRRRPDTTPSARPAGASYFPAQKWMAKSLSQNRA
jgi:hypothetical protein